MKSLAGGSAYEAGESGGDKHEERTAEPPLERADAEAVEQRGPEERSETGDEKDGHDRAGWGAADDVVVRGRCHELVTGSGFPLDTEPGPIGSRDDTLSPFTGSDGLRGFGGSEGANPDVAGGEVGLVEGGGAGLERRGLGFRSVGQSAGSLGVSAAAAAPAGAPVRPAMRDLRVAVMASSRPGTSMPQKFRRSSA